MRFGFDKFKRFFKGRHWILCIFVFYLIFFIIYLFKAESCWEIYPKIQKKIDIGKIPSLDSSIIFGLYAGAIVCTVLSFIGVVIAFFIKKNHIKSFFKDGYNNQRDSNKPKLTIFILLISFGIISLGFFIRLPLANGGFWSDEVWMLRHNIYGKYYPEISPNNISEKQNFIQTSWKDALWKYTKPTNHILFGILSKSSLKTWQLLFSKSPNEFSHLAIRAPSLLAFIFSSIIIFYFGQVYFGRLYGFIPLIIFNFHPWVVFFSSNARAYSLTILLTLLILYSIKKIFENYSWGNFILFSLLIVLLNLNFPFNFSFFLLVFLSIKLLISNFSISNKVQNCIKLLISGLVVFIPFLFIFSVNLYQVVFWKLTDIDKSIDFTILKKFIIKLFFGIDKSDFYLGDNMLNLLLVISTILATLGLYSFYKKNINNKMSYSPINVLIYSICFTTVFFIILNFITSKMFFDRFYSYALIPSIFLLTEGLILISFLFRRKIFHILFFIVFITSFLLITYKKNYQSFKLEFDATKNVRNHINNLDKNKTLIMGYGYDKYVSQIYFPKIINVNSLIEIESVIEYIKKKKYKDVYLILNHKSLNEVKYPSGFKLINNKNVFFLYKIFQALSPNNYVYLYKLNDF